MSEVEGREKVFPTELRCIDHFVDAVGGLLIEAGAPVGIDERVVGDVLVQPGVQFVLEGFSLFLGEIGVNYLRYRHFAHPFGEAGFCQILGGFAFHGGKRGYFGGLVREDRNKFEIAVGGKWSMNVQMHNCLGDGFLLFVLFELDSECCCNSCFMLIQQ